MRQGFHPYQWILFMKRRARYYKVERGVRGFFVPEYMRKEAESRTLADSMENINAFNQYVYENYMSDMTPSTRYTINPRWHPVEALNMYGQFRSEGWDRLFYNEVAYEDYSKAEI